MGSNCLIFAITFNREEIARLLIDNGADLDATDARGQTALDHARMQGLEKLINLLENKK
jgi:ankyrin repeat protein